MPLPALGYQRCCFNRSLALNVVAPQWCSSIPPPWYVCITKMCIPPQCSLCYDLLCIVVQKTDKAVCQNHVPLVNIKIAGKWMFIPLKMVLIGIDPYPSMSNGDVPISLARRLRPPTPEQWPRNMLSRHHGSRSIAGAHQTKLPALQRRKKHELLPQLQKKGSLKPYIYNYIHIGKLVNNCFRIYSIYGHK